MEQLYDPRGHRKCLTEPERNRFLKAARSTDTPVRAFCEVLAYSGCRLSEALALAPERVDSAAGFLVFESLKRRRRGVFRAVPVPSGCSKRWYGCNCATPATARRRSSGRGLAQQPGDGCAR